MIEFFMTISASVTTSTCHSAQRQKPLQLNISPSNHILHEKRGTTDKYCFGKWP